MSLLKNVFKFENEFTVCGLLLNAFHEKQQEKHFFCQNFSRLLVNYCGSELALHGK